MNKKMKEQLTTKPRIEMGSWIPTLTSQFLICPVPFHLDTYHGCGYGCKYCFARDFYEFTRRMSEKKRLHI